MISSRHIWILLLFISVLANIHATARTFFNDDLKPITIHLTWQHQFQFAGYYAALENGYFKERGLDVQLEVEITQDNITPVTTGKYDYGLATGVSLLTHPQMSETTVLAGIFQQSPVALMALRSRGIHNLGDFAGKKIYGGSEIKAMLINAGVDISQIDFPGKIGGLGYVVNGDCDGTSFFITDFASQLHADTLQYIVFRPLEYGLNFYGECLFTSRERVASHPEEVAAIREAVIAGWQYAVEHPEEIAALINSKYNPAMSRETLMREAEATIHSLILPRFYDIGDMQKSKWRHSLELLRNLGLVEEGVSLDGFVYQQEEYAGKNLIDKYIWQIALAIAVVAAVVLLLLLYNYHLQKAVSKRTASLEKAMAEMDKFVYTVAHDIRSPLSSILGLVNIMRVDTANRDKYIDMIEQSINRLDQFTRDILDYNRISRASLKYEPVDIKALVEKIVDQLKYANNNNGLGITLDINLSKPFVTDPWRLEVVLRNVIGNAIKYRDSQKPQHLVKIQATRDGQNLRFVIEDNGKGIASEHLDKVFQMFYRASEDSQGTGMGLYLVKETISLLGGTLDIQSTEGQGTTFTFIIPEGRAS